MQDLVGMGWRPDLATGILSNLDRIDVLEVIAEDFYETSAGTSALKSLAKQVPVTIHGVSLGMASASPVDCKRLEKMARLVDRVQPESWSEHLAFVRAGDIEIGHLAAPPMTSDTIECTAANLVAAEAIVGLPPLMENIATLIYPPASDRDEPAWLSETMTAANGQLLLDLHNLFANSINFGLDPKEFLARLPADRIYGVHISGGQWIDAGDAERRRILDDHRHDPPDPVYELLADLASQCPNRLTVILERDGDYPPMEHLLAQIDRARSALRRGRVSYRAQSIPTSSRLPLERTTQAEASACGGFNG
ncbi:MAG: DUF692 family multinuclear iron-containing protein [Terracidiphilus sp.]|jgi:uncharacterized protein (UPF0276 family)